MIFMKYLNQTSIGPTIGDLNLMKDKDKRLSLTIGTSGNCAPILWICV